MSSSQSVILPPTMVAENIEDIMYAANEDQRKVYWSILDTIFYFILRRRIYYARLGPSPQPIRFPAMNMFLATAITNEVRQAIQNNQQFTRVAYSWSVTLAKSNALDQGIASLGQTRPCINTLQSLVDLKSDPALKQPGASIPLDNEVDYLAAKEWCYRQEVRKAHAKLGQDNGTDDIPQTQRDQKKLANDLSLAAMNEVEMVDLEYHGKENKKKLNYIVQRKRELSALDVALFGWEASLALRDGHLGLSRGSSATTRLDIEAYQTHKERSDILTKLFHVSKASVMNTYSLPHLARFACNPKAELQTKISNKSTNDKRRELIKIGTAERGKLAATQKNKPEETPTEEA